MWSYGIWITTLTVKLLFAATPLLLILLIPVGVLVLEVASVMLMPAPELAKGVVTAIERGLSSFPGDASPSKTCPKPIL
jgi:hypothetical protein